LSNEERRGVIQEEEPAPHPWTVAHQSVHAFTLYVALFTTVYLGSFSTDPTTVIQTHLREIRGSLDGSVMFTGEEDIEDLLKPGLAPPKAANVAAAAAVTSRDVANGAVCEEPVDGGDSGRGHGGVRRCVNCWTALLVDLIRGLYDECAVGHRIRRAVRSLDGKAL
jgi:hypothetical protein